MYRYIIDNAITYTSEDLVLFKESPFACWMERLTLENPDHGIPPDFEGEAPGDTREPQSDLTDTLRAEGKDVIQVDWEIEEPLRRTATLEAMRHGVDFIVNGQLSLGTLSGSANLLMRTSGYSELGNYLYVPCNTQPTINTHSALRLCFLADLLDSLQGQLPPQLLIIRDGADVVPLQTEDHIYHYRAVKQRFMSAQRAFREHKIPDPSESSHFGRWGDCANQVLKQRALQSDIQDTDSRDADANESSISDSEGQSDFNAAYDFDEVKNRALTRGADSANFDGTLVEQARLLSPDDIAPTLSRGHAGDTLQNLEFIGSSIQKPAVRRGNPREPRRRPVHHPIREHPPMPSRMAPPPNLRNPALDESSAIAARVVVEGRPLGSIGIQSGVGSMVDLDITGSAGTREVTSEPGPEIKPPEAPTTTERFADSDNPTHQLQANSFDSCLITGDPPDREDNLS